jgi:hypothetical protein
LNQELQPSRRAGIGRSVQFFSFTGFTIYASTGKYPSLQFFNRNHRSTFSRGLSVIGFILRMILSIFLDKEGRIALARRAQVSSLEDELKIEMAKTNALVKALNQQGDQRLGISETRKAEVQSALASQAKAQEALSELYPETRRRMIERALVDQPATAPAKAETAQPGSADKAKGAERAAEKGPRP